MNQPPAQRTAWTTLLTFLLVGLILFLLARLDLPALGAGIAVSAIGLLIWILPADPPVARWRVGSQRGWFLDGLSPIRQQLVITGTQQCALYFWMREKQSMDYRIDVLDADGNDVPKFVWDTEEPHRHPGKLCWCGAEGGPGGTIYLVESMAGWAVTIRYQMRAMHSDVIHGASVAVDVQPTTADVQFPAAPTPLTEPITSLPSVPGDSAASVTSD